MQDRMRATWDDLARRNAMHFISTDRIDWDQSEFLAEGRERLRLLAAQIAVLPSSWHGTALDLGCGIGRFSFALTEYFPRVIALDVSEEMIARGRKLAELLGDQRVEFRRNNGMDLAGVDDRECDLVFSYVVLQHIPDLAVVAGYIREMARVVRPNGHVMFQVLTYRASVLATLLRLVRQPLLWLLGAAERLRILQPEQGIAFQGSRMTLGQVEQLTQLHGLDIIAVSRRDAGHLLCDETLVYCRKRNATS